MKKYYLISPLLLATFLVLSCQPGSNKNFDNEGEILNETAKVDSIKSNDKKDIALGKTKFYNCSACHAENNIMIGVSFQKIRERRSIEWIRGFIKNGIGMVENGDAIAICVSNEHNGIVHPPQDVTDDEIEAILDYVDSFPYKPEYISKCK